MILAKRLFSTFPKFRSSALYITGDKAQKMCVILTPAIDFEDRLKEKSELRLNLKVRQSKIDIDKVEQRWNFYKHFEYEKIVLETTRTVIGEKLRKLMTESDKNTDVIKQLTTHMDLVKDDLRILRDYLYGIENDIMLQVLSLPNVLHKDTPHDNSIIFHIHGERPSKPSKSHIEATKLIEYTNEFFYFLKDEAAHFELACTHYASDTLKAASFVQFDNPDFTRSIIVEGCGSDVFTNRETFTLEDIHNDTSNELSRLHLTGGASLCAFMAYFARHSIQENYFPLKLFGCGRKYQPASSKEASLFNVGQETAVELFIATEDDDAALQKQFDELTDVVINLYKGLGEHFCLVYEPAHKLKKHESLRLSIQMYSNYLQRYVEVGNCSIYDSYVSKRLMFNYTVNKERRFPKIISGSLLRIQPFLACKLENNDLKCNMFDNVLKNYVLPK